MAFIIKFEKENCMPCKFSDQFLENEMKISIANETVAIKDLGELTNSKKIHVIDIFNSPELVEKFNVQSVPTFIKWDGTEVLEQFSGFNPGKMKELF